MLAIALILTLGLAPAPDLSPITTANTYEPPALEADIRHLRRQFRAESPDLAPTDAARIENELRRIERLSQDKDTSWRAQTELRALERELALTPREPPAAR